MKRSINLPLHIPTLLFSAVIVGLYVFFTQFVFAHGGDTNLIHGCVKNNGDIKIVGVNENCPHNQTPLDWRKGLSDPPFACPGCNFHLPTSANSRFSGKDLTNSFLSEADFGGVDLSGTILVNAELSGINFISTNLTNANLTGASGLESADLTNIIWSNTICPDGTNSDNNGNTCEGHL